MAKRLSDSARDTAFEPLKAKGWSLSEDATAIHKVWKFKDFSQAWGFMARVAMEAEKRDHHPDWSNSYNKVEITLSTHSAKGLTALDFDLAESLESF